MSAPHSLDANLLLYPAFCAAVAALAYFESGWNTAIANVPEHAIRTCKGDVVSSTGLPQCLPMTDALWGFAVGAHALGGFFGGLVANHLQGNFGRKKTLLFNTCFWLAGSIITSLAINAVVLIIGRLLLGIGTGIGTVVASTYINEISTPRSRGTLGCFSQLSTTVGILLTELVGLALSFPVGWRILFALTCFPALLQIVLLYYCPESPRHHVRYGDLDKARGALSRLRKGHDIDQELQTIVADHATQIEKDTAQSSLVSLSDFETSFQGNSRRTSVSDGRYGLKQVWQDKLARKRLFLCMLLHAGQQATGVNVIIFFSTAIFAKQFGIANAQRASIGIAGLNVIATLFSTFVVERAGRKMLLCLSSLGMSLFATLMVIASFQDSIVLTSVAAAGFSLAFSVGLGPIPFLIIGELAPRQALSITASLSLATNWLFNFVLGFAFPILSKALHGYVFVVFASLSLAYAVFTFFCIPETKVRASN